MKILFIIIFSILLTSCQSETISKKKLNIKEKSLNLKTTSKAEMVVK